MNKTTGFTLIEVLIAMLILAVGLLGLAGLQVTGLRNNQSAYHRSQATQLAYDIADRMRSNVVNAETLGASVYITMDPDDADDQAACIAVAGTCTAAQMAQQDLFEWNRDLAAILPSGLGSIALAGSLFTITINWDDNRDGCINNAIDTPAAGCTDKPNDPNFQMSFQL